MQFGAAVLRIFWQIVTGKKNDATLPAQTPNHLFFEKLISRSKIFVLGY